MTDHVTEDLSTVDDAQLARWAYGRASDREEHDRAQLAAAELARRAASQTEPEDAHPTAGLDGEVPPNPFVAVTDHRHERRMRAIGIVGVMAALLGIGPIAIELTRITQDPLTIFDRAETSLDREWIQTLAIDPQNTFTAGPRVFHHEDGRIGIVARVSTVPEGRSTDWDAYCLYLGREADDGSSGFTTACTYPRRFDTDGLVIFDRGSFDGEGFDAAVWGPVGPPRVDDAQQLDSARPARTVIDILANPFDRFSADRDSIAIVGDLETLLMGPVRTAANPSIAGDELAVHLYMLEGDAVPVEPEVCLHVTHPAAESVAVTCNPVSVVLAGELGLFVDIRVNGVMWIVSIDGTGVVRAQESSFASAN